MIIVDHNLIKKRFMRGLQLKSRCWRDPHLVGDTRRRFDASLVFLWRGCVSHAVSYRPHPAEH